MSLLGKLLGDPLDRLLQRPVRSVYPMYRRSHMLQFGLLCLAFGTLAGMTTSWLCFLAAAGLQ